MAVNVVIQLNSPASFGESWSFFVLPMCFFILLTTVAYVTAELLKKTVTSIEVTFGPGTSVSSKK